MIDWLLAPADLPNWLYMLMFMWMLWASMGYGDYRRRCKNLEHAQLILARKLDQYESGWEEAITGSRG